MASPNPAHAFCGFYVSGSGASLENDATNVVLLRQGTHTVLTMQNNYQGPIEDFAMVVPVPQVLNKNEVKTLRDGVFARVNAMSAPRLVEYFEADPCPQPLYGIGVGASFSSVGRGAGGMGLASKSERSVARPRPRVVVKSSFAVGEYDIKILESNDAAALDEWLRKHKYTIPRGAKRVLGPYIQQGMYFFVAKVDADKVRFQGKKARLSPLRFHYNSENFSLPVRLGLLNSSGEQDLIVHTIGHSRYEVANMRNVTVPTNLEVRAGVKPKFGQFYYALFDALMKQSARTVVTEYAWNPWIPVPGNRPGGKCDPCPPGRMMLTMGDLRSLGGDVVRIPPRKAVLTRLHTRYSPRTLKNDLVFTAASPLEGGLGMPDRRGRVTRRLKRDAKRNQFQGRYVILNRWMGPVSCAEPDLGNWTGAGRASTVSREQATGGTVHGKWKLATLKRFLRVDVPSLRLEVK